MQTNQQMDQEEYNYGEDERSAKLKNDVLDDLDYQERYNRAKKRVKEMEGFYYHLAVFVFMNIFFYFLDVRYDGSLDWAYWVWFGWGLGVLGHFLTVWEERKIHKLMNEDEKPKRRG
jgi:hypothetical protein